MVEEMKCTDDCDCPECLMEKRVSKPMPGFSSEALASLFNEDPIIRIFCGKCFDKGNCDWENQTIARQRCDYVMRAKI